MLQVLAGLIVVVSMLTGYFYRLNKRLSASLVEDDSEFLADAPTAEELSTTSYENVDNLAGLDAATIKGANHIVLGGAGLVGKEIVRLLCQLGCEDVRSLDLQEASDELSGLNFQHYTVDIANLEELQRIFDIPFKNCEKPVVIHHTASTIRFYERLHHTAAVSDKVNIEGTRNVIEAANNAFKGRKFLIYTSSAPCFAPEPTLWRETPREYILREDMPTLPESQLNQAHYPRTKRAAEKLTMEANGKNEMSTCILRPGMAILGTGDLAMMRYLTDKPPLVTFGKDFVSSRIDAQDLARAHLFAFVALSKHPEEIGGQPFLITGPRRVYRVRDFGRMIEILAGRDLQLVYISDLFFFLLGHFLEIVLYLRYQMLSLGGRKKTPLYPKWADQAKLLQPPLFSSSSVDYIIDDSLARKQLGYFHVWETPQTVKHVIDKLTAKTVI